MENKMKKIQGEKTSNCVLGLNFGKKKGLKKKGDMRTELTKTKHNCV